MKYLYANKQLLNLILLLILSRLLSFVYFSIFPFEHSLFGSVSPLTYHWFADITLYNQFIRILDFEIDAFYDFFNNYKYILNNQFDNIIRFPGFLYPTILKLTFYNEQNVIPLALLVLITEILASSLWIFFFKKQNIPFIFCLLFILLPFPWIFSILKSSDVFFYLLTTLFLLSAIKVIKINNKAMFFLLFLACMTRPSGLGLILAYLLYVFFLKQNFEISLRSKLLLLFVFIFSTLYYMPYFFSEINSLQFFETLNQQTLTFKDFIYLIPKYSMKILNILGMQETNSDNHLFYFFRVLESMILVIGFIYLLYKNNINIMYLVTVINLTFIIIFLFPAYRYSVAFLPILFLSFADFMLMITHKLLKIKHAIRSKH